MLSANTRKYQASNLHSKGEICLLFSHPAVPIPVKENRYETASETRSCNLTGLQKKKARKPVLYKSYLQNTYVQSPIPIVVTKEGQLDEPANNKKKKKSAKLGVLAKRQGDNAQSTQSEGMIKYPGTQFPYTITSSWKNGWNQIHLILFVSSFSSKCTFCKYCGPNTALSLLTSLKFSSLTFAMFVTSQNIPYVVRNPSSTKCHSFLKTMVSRTNDSIYISVLSYICYPFSLLQLYVASMYGKTYR